MGKRIERQINRTEEMELVESLEKVISEWWSDASSNLKACPWTGDRTHNLMARAAINILLANKDTEVYMQGEGMIREEW